jgi:hypothetical protein
MAPREGFEPPTNRLTADRSTTELPRNAAPPGTSPERPDLRCLAVGLSIPAAARWWVRRPTTGRSDRPVVSLLRTQCLVLEAPAGPRRDARLQRPTEGSFAAGGLGAAGRPIPDTGPKPHPGRAGEYNICCEITMFRATRLAAPIRPALAAVRCRQGDLRSQPPPHPGPGDLPGRRCQDRRNARRTPRRVSASTSVSASAPRMRSTLAMPVHCR